MIGRVHRRRSRVDRGSAAFSRVLASAVAAPGGLGTLQRRSLRALAGIPGLFRLLLHAAAVHEAPDPVIVGLGAAAAAFALILPFAAHARAPFLPSCSRLTTRPCQEMKPVGFGCPGGTTKRAGGHRVPGR